MLPQGGPGGVSVATAALTCAVLSHPASHCLLPPCLEEPPTAAAPLCLCGLPRACGLLLLFSSTSVRVFLVPVCRVGSWSASVGLGLAVGLPACPASGHGAFSHSVELPVADGAGSPVPAADPRVRCSCTGPPQNFGGLGGLWLQRLPTSSPWLSDHVAPYRSCQPPVAVKITCIKMGTIRDSLSSLRCLVATARASVWRQDDSIAELGGRGGPGGASWSRRS